MGLRTWAFQWLYKQIEPYISDDVLASTVISGFSPRQEVYDYFSGTPLTRLELASLVSPLIKPNIDLISGTASTSTMRVEENIPGTEEYKQVPNHELEAILNIFPFPDFGAKLAWRFTFTWLLLRGEAYWMIVPNGFGELWGMVPIPAFMMKPVPWHQSMGGDPKLIAYFLYAPADPQHPVMLPPEVILYHRLPNVIYSHRGWSPMMSYDLMIQTVGEADRFDLDDYKNGLALAKIFSLKSGMPKREFTQAMADYVTAKNEGRRDQFVRAGDMSVQDVAQRRGETGQNVHVRGKEYADRVLNVPKGVRGEDVTFASAKVAETTFRRDTVDSLLMLRDEDVNGKITFPLYGINFRVKSDTVVPEDAKNQREQDEFNQRVWTIDEIRAKQNLASHPDPSIGNAIPLKINPIGVSSPLDSDEEEEAENMAIAKALFEGEGEQVALEGRCPQCHQDGTVIKFIDHQGLCYCTNCARTFDLEAGWKLLPSNGSP